MPRFAANLTLMFNEVPFLDRFEAGGEGWLYGGRIPVSLRLPGGGDRQSACRITA